MPMNTSLNRRDFMKLGGGALAMAALQPAALELSLRTAASLRITRRSLAATGGQRQSASQQHGVCMPCN